MAVCKFCSKEFIPCHNSKGIFCSKSCASKSRWSDKEYKERVSSNLKKAYTNPDLRRKMSESTTELWKDEDYRRNMSEKISSSVDRIPGLREIRSKIAREKGFVNINKVNKGELYWSTELNKLGIKYEEQKIFKTGIRRPTFYRMDFYLPDYSIDLEIDGNTHDIQGRKERDNRRDRIMNESGIRVVRMNSRTYGTRNTIEDLKVILRI